MEAGRRPYLFFVWEYRNVAAQGRYRWCHDQVIRMLANALERERKKNRPRKKSGPQLISCVKEDTTKLTATTSSRSCILQDEND
ncbi:hypothetical protein DPMN_155324 [Dreissena polymorpha]|uniref:Uncharacterized protein n=1 Tax=Dreissena polymorpha TaxID=45954 RepID=A0A9D4J6J1_DREPO|nr:hypothetical protein DPMN_155324 [Dreissena polymorpha]